MNDSKTWQVEVAPPAQRWYDRMTLEIAVADVKTMVEEWSYEEDAHNYCHVRPMLVKLVEAATGRGVEWVGGR